MEADKKAQRRSFARSCLLSSVILVAICNVFGPVDAFLPPNAVHVKSAFEHRHTSTDGRTKCNHPAFTTSEFYRRPSSEMNNSKDGKHNMEELMLAAQDPKTFEEYVLKQKKKEDEGKETRIVSNHNNNTSASSDSSNDPVTEKKGYVPIEQWDEERSKDSMSWEERVQYDGQKFGNRFQQNEILRKNLNSW